jgi:hypothetical protein
MFAGSDTGNYHLTADSPLIDSGDPRFEALRNETDIDGEARIVGAAVDIGADEFLLSGDIDADGVVGIADLLALLSAWGACPEQPADCAADLDGNGEVNVEDLLELLMNWNA